MSGNGNECKPLAGGAGDADGEEDDDDDMEDEAGTPGAEGGAGGRLEDQGGDDDEEGDGVALAIRKQEADANKKPRKAYTISASNVLKAAGPDCLLTVYLCTRSHSH